MNEFVNWKSYSQIAIERGDRNVNLDVFSDTAQPLMEKGECQIEVGRHGDRNRVESNGPVPNGRFHVQPALPMVDKSYDAYFYRIGSLGRKVSALKLPVSKASGCMGDRELPSSDT